MANPQLENGYIRIANEIGEKLSKTNLSQYEWRLLWAIFRKTYGWNKKMDFVSVTQMEEITGLDRRNISRTKKSLLSKNIIVCEDGMIGFNKDFNDWLLSGGDMRPDISYRDTRPKHFPPLGFRYKNGHQTHCEMCCGVFDWSSTHNHHILPKSMGGRDRIENYARLCVGCHEQIHRQIDEYVCVYPDDPEALYRHFVSLLSSMQTTFLSSVETNTKDNKDNYKRKSVANAHSPEINKFKEEWNNLFNKYFGSNYVFSHGRDGKTIKGMLRTIAYDELVGRAELFLKDNDNFYQTKSGHTLGVFSVNVNKYVTKKPTEVKGYQPERLTPEQEQAAEIARRDAMKKLREQGVLR